MKQLKKPFLFLSTLAVVILCFTACNDFLEEDISGETPELLIPQDGDTISEFSNFMWKEIVGATRYRVEIYSPSFNAPEYIAIDTTVKKLDIFLTLSPDKYQLRIMGFNNGYESLKSDPIDFWVDTVSGNQAQIELLTPSATSFYSADFDGQFSWTSLPNVSSYEMSLREGTNYENGTILYTQNGISSTTHNVTGVTFDEGEYVWGVKATFNQGNSTGIFTKTFQVDSTNPPVPNSQTPADLSIVTSPVDFTWSTPADVGQIQSPITTHIDIATDVNFDDIIESSSTQNNSTQITINQTGTFYWSLYNVDEAGNQSDYSVTREFTIN
ncbi:MAG: hypothetical protein WED10_05265 [Brumimicrobium sp.]